MKYRLKSAWAIALITLLNTGCKKESEILLEEKGTATNLISGIVGSKSQVRPFKAFPWESAQATEIRERLMSQKRPYAVPLPHLNYYRELQFKNDLESTLRDAFNDYAKDFEISEPWSKQAKEKFIKALKGHMKDSQNSLIGCVIDDKRTLSHMMNIYNPRTRLNVELNKSMPRRAVFFKVTKVSPSEINSLAASGRWPSLSQ